MGRIRCFFLEPVDYARRSLRRFQFSTEGVPCPEAPGYHNASVDLGDEPYAETNAGRGLLPTEEEKRDPRWPTVCACGHVFTPAEQWQVNLERLYRRPDTGELTTLREAPPGAMWDAYWMGDSFRGRDGRCLVVKTPAGEWCVDGPSNGGGRWARTDDLSNLTVRPSIAIGEPVRYHAFLTDGFLEDC
jgi:hypothetical protein